MVAGVGTKPIETKHARRGKSGGGGPEAQRTTTRRRKKGERKKERKKKKKKAHLHQRGQVELEVRPVRGRHLQSGGGGGSNEKSVPVHRISTGKRRAGLIKVTLVGCGVMDAFFAGRKQTGPPPNGGYERCGAMPYDVMWHEHNVASNVM